MKEAFLHFLWRTRRFNWTDLRTTDHQTIQILQAGEYNTHAGPDFFNARIRIGDTEWAGNVEMHVRSSEWAEHGHSDDPAYNNVVLHVVWTDDAPVRRPHGELLPCVELNNRVLPGLLETYQQLMDGQQWIPCSARFSDTPSIIRLNWLDRLSAERLEEKTAYLSAQLLATDNHWEEAFYRVLAWSFGLKVNSQPFEMLARSLPLVILGRHKNDLFQTEALLFGQAGLLEGSFTEEYPKKLAKEYHFLRHKYQLTPIEGSMWKFLRLRPANFPTVRLAQFAQLIHQSVHLFSQLLEVQTVREAERLFQVELQGYWQMHYRLDAPSGKRAKRTGDDFMNTLLINTLIPALFLYGKTRHLPEYQAKAIRWLQTLRPEENTITTGWKELGMLAQNSAESQALLQLKNKYCDQRRCLECSVGTYLMK